MKGFRLGLKFGTTICFAMVVSTAYCQRPGDLVITPTRLSLDSKNRTGDLTLVNRGSQAIRYRLRFVDMEMSEDGTLSRSSTKTVSSGVDIFRLSPREILLQPGEFQRIKVLAAFPAGTKDGEFRSHLAFEPILMARSQQLDQGDGQSIKLSLELRSVVTIPVIAKFGQTSGTATLSNATVTKDDQGWLAKFTLGRAGNRTVRGHATVTFHPEGGGRAQIIGEISGLPVYFPNPLRNVTVRLTQDVAKLGKGKIEISFVDPERPKGAPPLKATANIVE